MYWLSDRDNEPSSSDTLHRLTHFAKRTCTQVSEEELEVAADHLNVRWVDGDVSRWVALACFWHDPHFLWNFMLDAIEAAVDDDDLSKIASELAEHILAHYGTMMPYFEHQAARDDKFARMLTGVWRHRMCDDVWIRLRAMQARVQAPLLSMIPIENGVEYRAGHMSADDRATPDKGRYRRDTNGEWYVSWNRTGTKAPKAG